MSDFQVLLSKLNNWYSRKPSRRASQASSAMLVMFPRDALSGHHDTEASYGRAVRSSENPSAKSDCQKAKSAVREKSIPQTYRC